jgi:hypothetical protein
MLGEGTFPYDLACGEGGEGIFQQTSFLQSHPTFSFVAGEGRIHCGEGAVNVR